MMAIKISGSLRISRLLITIATLCYGIIPLVVDLTETHAFHPDWPAHARFHMVWLLGTNTSLALFALVLMWATKIEAALSIRLGGVIALCVYGGFFISTFTANLYGGALVDERGGVPPLMGMDANLVAFIPLTLLAIFGLCLAFKDDPSK